MGSKRIRNKPPGALLAFGLLGALGCPRGGGAGGAAGASGRHPAVQAPVLRVLGPGRVFTVDGDRVLDARGAVLARVVPAGLVASDAGPRVTMDPDGRWVIDGLGAAVLGPDGALLDDHGRTLTLEPDGMVRLRTIRGRTSVAPVRVEGLTPARRRVALGVVLLALREERQAQAPEGVDAGQGAPADASPDAQRPGR